MDLEVWVEEAKLQPSRDADDAVVIVVEKQSSDFQDCVSRRAVDLRLLRSSALDILAQQAKVVSI